MIRVRVDDFPHTTKREPQHTHAAFREFHKELSNGIGGKRYLLGVIPKQCTVDDLLLVRNETNCVVGMHGIVHDEQQLNIHGNEFPRYLTQRTVLDRLKETRTALEAAVGQRVSIYMPPRNLVDGRTFEILDLAGFDFCTGGPETDLVGDFGDVPVALITSNPPYEYGRSDELYAFGAHNHLQSRELNQDGSTKFTAPLDHVLTLHWTWEVNIGLHHLRKFFEQFPDKSVFEDFDG